MVNIKIFGCVFPNVESYIMSRAQIRLKKQNSLRRIFTGPLVVCMLAMMLLPAAARFVAIRSVTVDLSINSSGYASCDGTCTVASGYEAEATLELQQKDGSTWKTIKEWSDSGDVIRFNKAQFVARGYDYRLKLTTEVYDANGKFVEDDVTYSGVESH